MKKFSKRISATHLITTIDPGDNIFRPPSINPKNHLKLFFEDDDRQDLNSSPKNHHVESIINFVKDTTTESSVILVHCFAGISRSTAVALGVKKLLNPEIENEKLSQWINDIRPNCVPNILVGMHFDNLLNLGGSFLDICIQIGNENLKRRFDL